MSLRSLCLVCLHFFVGSHMLVAFVLRRLIRTRPNTRTLLLSTNFQICLVRFRFLHGVDINLDPVTFQSLLALLSPFLFFLFVFLKEVAPCRSTQRVFDTSELVILSDPPARSVLRFVFLVFPVPFSLSFSSPIQAHNFDFLQFVLARSLVLSFFLLLVLVLFLFLFLSTVFSFSFSFCSSSPFCLSFFFLFPFPRSHHCDLPVQTEKWSISSCDLRFLLFPFFFHKEPGSIKLVKVRIPKTASDPTSFQSLPPCSLVVLRPISFFSFPFASRSGRPEEVPSWPLVQHFFAPCSSYCTSIHSLRKSHQAKPWCKARRALADQLACHVNVR
jgi:hypothetical protein